jgi:hypothetical protein
MQYDCLINQILSRALVRLISTKQRKAPSPCAHDGLNGKAHGDDGMHGIL